MGRNYNNIYKLLVKDEGDIYGHIAYSIYKANKIEYIEKFKEEHGGNQPTEDELKPFHDLSCTESSINLYEMKAEAVVHDFASEVLGGLMADMERDYIINHNAHLESIIEPIKPKKGRQFLMAILASVVGAFFFALFVAAMAFIRANNRSDASVSLGDSVEQMIEETFITHGHENDSTATFQHLK